MKHKKRKKSPAVIYEINTRCLDLKEFSGFFSRRKRTQLYDSIMKEISRAVLDLFNEVEKFSFIATVEGFYILVWTVKDHNRLSRLMSYVRDRFAEKVNRYLDRVGPIWDGQWTYTVIDVPEED